MELPFPARHDPDVLLFYVSTVAGHLSQAVREMNSALRNARISIMSIKQGLRKIKQMNNE